ncbi:MAG: D-alanyl-D-alanine carboxypeptidase, partial [Firmicutes bacterium]|nr:D-alanyl-D-alanine carboxypeptidase [Bacillota bacterium]
MSSGMRLSVSAVIIAVLLVVFGVVQMVRPIPKPVLAQLVPSKTAVPGAAPYIPWPSGTDSAAAVAGIGFVGQHGPNVPMPIGSMAKMMTAYLVLKA